MLRCVEAFLTPFRYAADLKNGDDRPGQDFGIKPQRPSLNVLDIVNYFCFHIIHRYIVFMIGMNLCPTRNTRSG